MDTLSLIDVTPLVFAFGIATAVLAGLIKGVIGFAMPMIFMSGLGSIAPAEVALGWLIIPTLVTNVRQGLRYGLSAARASLYKFRLFLCVGGVCLILAAQLVRWLPGSALLLIIGVPISIYATLNLMGRDIQLRPNPGPRVEAAVGAVAGVLGGLTGVWGAPTVALLTAMKTEKAEQVRVLGVIFALGAVALFIAHLGSGVLNVQTASFSALLVIPALLGQWLGFYIHDRIDQAAFRKLTLVFLLLGGLNLIRRAVFGA